jgi:phosphatidylethanolamine/phosphatidyl-N-methylethanolamine N-methyltransferase
VLHEFTDRVKSRFADEIRFLDTLMREPKSVGALWPTGQVMARSMASVVKVDSPLPVLELGPGTGVITKAILSRGIEPGKVHAVEYAAPFARELRIRFPDIHVHQGDAFALGETLGNAATLIFDCAISALPLLNFPMAKRLSLIDDVLSRLPAGRPMIQFSYGPMPPVPAKAGLFSVDHHDFVLLNLPPARIWTYTRPQQ